MQQIVTRLSDEDLERVRRSQARVNALSAVPTVTLDEAEEIHYKHMLLTAEMVEVYEIDTAEDWSINTFTGQVAYDS